MPGSKPGGLKSGRPTKATVAREQDKAKARAAQRALPPVAIDGDLEPGSRLAGLYISMYPLSQ